MPAPPDESAEDLYENAPCGYLSTDADGLVLRVNATFLRWTRYRREELVGRRRFAELLTGGGRIYHETHYAPLLRMQGSVREIALDIVRADGTRLPVLVNSEVRGEVVRTTVFDATDRKRYEQELLAARNREREARERVERLQRITATLAVAPTAPAVAAAVAGELTEYLGASGAGVALREGGGELEVLAVDGALPPDAFAGPAGYDAGEAGGRGARARLGPDGRARLAVAFGGLHEFTPDERAFLRTCSEQTALALERVRLDELQRDVASTLQMSLLAGALPSDPRYEVATAYRPAMAHLEVGGDWYDAFTLPDGRVAISVGDVVGRGIAAASTMGQLRSAVRALAGAGMSPAALLDHLDTFVDQAEPARFATLVYADVEPATGRVRCAAAGHPPPLVVTPGRAPEFFAGGRSTPLGVTLADEPRGEAAFELVPGGGFLLYTDGLVERRRESIDVGLARLVEAVAAHAGASAQELVEAVPDAVAERGAVHDDICLLSFRLRG